jgi:hypothetical protein
MSWSPALCFGANRVAQRSDDDAMSREWDCHWKYLAARQIRAETNCGPEARAPTSGRAESSNTPLSDGRRPGKHDTAPLDAFPRRYIRRQRLSHRCALHSPPYLPSSSSAEVPRTLTARCRASGRHSPGCCSAGTRLVDLFTFRRQLAVTAEAHSRHTRLRFLQCTGERERSKGSGKVACVCRTALPDNLLGECSSRN